MILDFILGALPLVFLVLMGELGGDFSNKNGVKSPDLSKGFPCGYPHGLAVHYGVLDGEKVPIYYLNETAKKLKAGGAKITVDRMFDDILYKFTYTNGSTTKTMGFDGHGGLAPVGGKPALRTRAYYMAQLGHRRGTRINWLCDGILINRRWVLTAGHCFINQKGNPNVLRLGDYDVSVPPEQGTSFHGKFIEDYDIGTVIFHPGYDGEEWYHDLALIPLDRPIPKYSSSINPVCLPWDREISFVGSNVALTGWGATKFRGPKTPLLQEVQLEVYETSVCDKSYSTIDNFKKKYPRGLKSNTTLCAGWLEGGKDACGGDSGGPLVYDRKDGYIMLIGVVSSGYGCGLKEFPGLYIPVSHPEYLKWIKETAFKDYL